MPGINTGILTNAYPLSAERIKELEKEVLETQSAIAYLNEDGELCFALPHGVEGIKDLAWTNTYELTAGDDALIKNAYKKAGLKSFYLKETLQKQSQDDAWELSSVTASNFELANGHMLITSDNLIFKTKEY